LWQVFLRQMQLFPQTFPVAQTLQHAAAIDLDIHWRQSVSRPNQCVTAVTETYRPEA